MSITKISDTSVDTLFCNRIIVRPPTTTLKWDPNRRNASFALLGSTDTAKTTTLPGDKGMLAAAPLVVGTSPLAWILSIYQGTTLNVGLASPTQSTSTSTGVAAARTLQVVEGDTIRFELTVGPSPSLLIRHETGGGAPKTSATIPLSQFIGQTLSPWMAAPPGSTVSALLLLDVELKFTVDTTGRSHVNGFTADIVDFSPATLQRNNPNDTTWSAGGGGGNSLVNENTTSTVVIQDSGIIYLDGALAYKSRNITTPDPSVAAAPDDYMLIASNPATTEILLPPILAGLSTSYIIKRNYPIQPGETDTPVMVVSPTPPDTIDGELLLGIPAYGITKLLSDGVSMWSVI